ncbi:hypothetical protein BC941DRAFT_410802 [Chlamydoabsidia padenii]|nr:hypothetical protein BC941DRAFT_410802 [Chlamydoabsidia padenii]
MDYFLKTKPTHWNLLECLKNIKKENPEHDFAYHIYILKDTLRRILDQDPNKLSRDKAKKILDNWKANVPKFKDVQHAYVGTVTNANTNTSAQAHDKKGKRRQSPAFSHSTNIWEKRPTTASDHSDDNNTPDIDDFFLTDKHTFHIQKKTKSHAYITPQQKITSPHKPRINETDFATLKTHYDIILSDYHASHSTPYSRTMYDENMEEQSNNKCLSDVPGTSKFLLSALRLPLDQLPRYLWTNGYDDCTKDEEMNNEMVRYILTDFSLNTKINTNKTTNERTPYSEHFIPIFKAFAGATGLMDFDWCEKTHIANHTLPLCLPTTTPLRTLLDGIGVSVKDRVERLLIESSGIHAEEDTLNQISNTTNCLKLDMRKYKLASYSTFLKRQVFGIHFVHDRMTLSSTRMMNKDRYSFVEVRSSRIPTTYGERFGWVKVIELLLKLKNNLLEQEQVTELLEMECVDAASVDQTVQVALKL